MSSFMTPSAARATMNYTLEKAAGPRPKKSMRAAGKRFVPLLATEKGNVIKATVAITISSMATLVAPVLIIRAIDTYIRPRQGEGLLRAALLVLAIYVAGA